MDKQQIPPLNNIVFEWVEIMDAIMNEMLDLKSPLLKSFNVDLTKQVIVIQSEKQFYKNIGMKF